MGLGWVVKLLDTFGLVGILGEKRSTWEKLKSNKSVVNLESCPLLI